MRANLSEAETDNQGVTVYIPAYTAPNPCTNPPIQWAMKLPGRDEKNKYLAQIDEY